MTVGSLFSGIGGLELGLERAGFGPVVWQAEQSEFCRQVLAKHWPGAKRYSDVREVDEHAETPTVICGGFPCQDLSYAGRGAGLAGQRSGLWSEYARIVRTLRPRVVVVENVPALLTRGFETVLGDLAACGYDCWWDCIPAAAVGAPHRRDRLFVVAHANSAGRKQQWGAIAVRAQLAAPERCDWWASEPDVGRVAHGVPRRVDRLGALGNAVVPQVAEVVGRRTMALLRGAA